MRGLGSLFISQYRGRPSPLALDAAPAPALALFFTDFDCLTVAVAAPAVAATASAAAETAAATPLRLRFMWRARALVVACKQIMSCYIQRTGCDRVVAPNCDSEVCVPTSVTLTTLQIGGGRGDKQDDWFILRG